MASIVGVDPGTTTGVCLIVADDRSNDFQVVGVWQIPWEDRLSFFPALLHGTFTNQGKPQLPEVVVIESFHLRPGRAMEQVGSVFPSVRIIGIVEAFASLCTPEPLLVLQDPSVIGRVEILQQHSAMLSTLIHAQDAYRHARYYCLTTSKR